MHSGWAHARLKLPEATAAYETAGDTDAVKQLFSFAHIHTHTHTHIHTHTHTYTHTFVFGHMHIYRYPEAAAAYETAGDMDAVKQLSSIKHTHTHTHTPMCLGTCTSAGTLKPPLPMKQLEIWMQWCAWPLKSCACPSAHTRYVKITFSFTPLHKCCVQKCTMFAHTHTHTHTYTHTDTHTCTHMHTRTHTHTSMPEHLAFPLECCTNVRAQECTNVRTRKYAGAHLTCTRRAMRTHEHIYAHTHTHPHKHTQTHTHIHTHTCTGGAQDTQC